MTLFDRIASIAIPLTLGVAVSLSMTPTLQAVEMEFGFAKVDVTPTEPVRLSGYGSRSKPTATVVQRLFARAMALKAEGGDAHVLVSVDTIGVSANFTDGVFERLRKSRELSRERFVLATTHSHTTPHLAGIIPNLFTVELTDDERAASERYTKKLADAIVEVSEAALDDLAPGRLAFGQGEVDFAINRRVIVDGKWSGFGETPDGVVDRSLPVLRVLSPDGKLRGVVCNYACHCTTPGPADQVCGDWAGYGAGFIEAERPGVVSLVTVGCGADANPRGFGSSDNAIAHGRSLADEALRVIAGELDSVDAAPVAAFSFAELPIEVPSGETIRAEAESNNVPTRRRAERMLATLDRGETLRDSYPVPVQTWRFDDELAMIFLGGEVVADYSLRLKREITGIDGVWVTAYANDVMAYVTSKRLRPEGGYEVDFSMVYYDLPGRWAASAEDLLVGKVLESLGEK